MHQKVEPSGEGLPDVGDRVEVIGRKLYEDEMEYDGCQGVILGVFSDSRGIKCATVKVVSETKERAGKHPFPIAALKKV